MAKKFSRRQFLKYSGTITIASGLLARSANASDYVAEQMPLGNTGLTISKLGLGCGTHSGRVQRALGHDGFNSMVHYAYDRGVRYLDTADGYDTHTWVREAIKGLPREDLFILTKMGGRPENPLKELDRFRKELGVDYIDSVLIHCKIHPDWAETHKRLINDFSEAKERGIIRSHGVSCHSLPALRVAADLDWVDVNLVRVNPQAVKLDTEKEAYFDESKPEHLDKVLGQIDKMHQQGNGVIGMKIIGEGAFKNRAEREKSIRFAMQPGLLNSMTIGFANHAELDEALDHMQNAKNG